MRDVIKDLSELRLTYQKGELHEEQVDAHPHAQFLNWFNFAFRLEEPVLNMLEINNFDFNSLEKIVYINSKSGIVRAPDPEKYNSCPLNFIEFNILQGNMTVNNWLYDHNYRNIPNAERLLSQYPFDNHHVAIYQKNFITYQHKILSGDSTIHVSKRNINRL